MSLQVKPRHVPFELWEELHELGSYDPRYVDDIVLDRGGRWSNRKMIIYREHDMLWGIQYDEAKQADTEQPPFPNNAQIYAFPVEAVEKVVTTTTYRLLA